MTPSDEVSQVVDKTACSTNVVPDCCTQIVPKIFEHQRNMRIGSCNAADCKNDDLDNLEIGGKSRGHA